MHCIGEINSLKTKRSRKIIDYDSFDAFTNVIIAD